MLDARREGEAPFSEPDPAAFLVVASDPYPDPEVSLSLDMPDDSSVESAFRALGVKRTWPACVPGTVVVGHAGPAPKPKAKKAAAYEPTPSECAVMINKLWEQGMDKGPS